MPTYRPAAITINPGAAYEAPATDPRIRTFPIPGQQITGTVNGAPFTASTPATITDDGANPPTLTTRTPPVASATGLPVELPVVRTTGVPTLTFTATNATAIRLEKLTTWDGTPVTVDYGNGDTATTTGAPLDHTYPAPYTGPVTLTTTGAPFHTIYTKTGALSVSIADIAHAAPSARYLRIDTNATVIGHAADIPRTCTFWLTRYGDTSIEGDTTDLPRGLTYLYMLNNSLTGNTADLPRGITTLVLYGINTVTGHAADLPSSLRVANLYGHNMITTNLADVPKTIEQLYQWSTHAPVSCPTPLTMTTRGWRMLRVRGAAPMPTADVDRIVAGVNANRSTSSARRLWIQGPHPAPTSGTDTDQAELTAAGYDLRFN